jgi:hypothetical protein
MQMAHADDVARRGSKEIGVRWGLGVGDDVDR